MGGGGAVSLLTAPELGRPSMDHGGYGAAQRASLERRSLGEDAVDTSAPPQPQLRPGSEEHAAHEPISEVDKRDHGTPDDWVPRHPELIRLTGRHPFNCEPPPDVLMKRGMLTPPSLHYVRNHGPVPQRVWGGHTVSVGGLVNHPRTFTMDEILALPSVTVTATLVCAGNRRKEQNMVKKSKGFNWGPAATGCSHWTGVRMSTLLRACGVRSFEQGAEYVCFQGPEKELPQGDTTYGTSLMLAKAMNDDNDILVAYKQNGRWLTPDHGFPVRMIIPGHIGGRMVKWLTKITVTQGESNNYYHYYDNRVLPTQVTDAKTAEEGGYWHNPDWIINELNINSTITSPTHEEMIELDTQRDYTVHGYAYSGGTKIIRCELSLDDGDSWRNCEIQRFGGPNRAGKYWAWVHYSLDIPVGWIGTASRRVILVNDSSQQETSSKVDLMQTRELMCRAYDSAQNSQPMKLVWNLMGMMNNCVYRVKVHPTTTPAGAFALQFEHPCLATGGPGGWMNRADKVEEPVEEVKKGAAQKSGVPHRKVSMAEVEAHSSRESAWFVRDGKVYDGTAFMKDHPGGADSILIVAGQDASDEFNAIHSAKAKRMLDDFLIGELSADAEPPAGLGAENRDPNAASNDAESLVALNPRKRIAFALAEKEVLSHNVRRFRFALQSEQHQFGLPVGQHVFLYAKVKGELVVRAYSPTSSNDDLGHFDLVIKVYEAGVHPQFPDGGKMSLHLDSLAIGDTIEAKGPMGHFDYLGKGRYQLDHADHHATHMSFIAGGTGITPILQVINAVLKDSEDNTEMSLICANQTADDILLREDLDSLAAKHRNFRVWHTVSRPKKGEDWPYGVGRVSADMIKQHLFPAGPGVMAGMCGPAPMVNMACLPNLKNLGYTDEQCVVF